MKLCKPLLAAIGATVLLGVLVGSGSARSFSTSSQTFSIAFRRLEFKIPAATITCELRLEGSFHSRTITKSIGSLIGYLTSATLGPCGTGTATILRATLPWHIRYSGFQGTLPRITSIIAHTETRFRIREPFGVTCLFASTAERPATLTFHVEAGGGLTANRGGTIPAGPECLGTQASISSDAPSVGVVVTLI